MKKSLFPILSLSLAAAFVLAGCRPGADDPSLAPQADGGVPVSTVSAVLEDIPAELRHDAFEYYGLGYTEPIDKEMEMQGNVYTGTERSELKEIRDGIPIFVIRRTGGLGAIGEMEVSLEEDGLYVLSSTTGKLEGKNLEMPADLSPGKTWNQTSAFTTNDGSRVEHTGEFRVVGTETVQTKAGAREALLITSSGTWTQDGNRSKMETKSWYVRGRGAAKVEIVSTPDEGEKRVVVIQETE
jgi:hypothetical protein